MKVAFVIQRYGLEVNGGSEFLCRILAERLNRFWDLEVLTTCALDYTTWQDSYPTGLTDVNGVKVRRFRVDYPRSPLLFDRFANFAYTGQATLLTQERWAREQGPYSSDFLRHLDVHGNTYSVFFFFTYLYGFTFFGLPKVATKSILVPTAHDEPPFYLSAYQSVFSQARAWLFQTPEERDFVLKHFQLSPPHEVVSTGIDLRESPSCREFNELYLSRLKEPYFLYLGRIEEAKGCSDLFHKFIQFKEKNPQQRVKLALIGKAVMPIPQHPDIQHLGFVSEEVKFAALSHSIALIMPSPYESLSLATLEAWSVGTPVLCTQKSIVLQGQCQRSGGGIIYGDPEEFEKAMTQLIQSSDLRKRLGEKGKNFVTQNYLWRTVEESYQNWAKRIGSNL